MKQFFALVLCLVLVPLLALADVNTLTEGDTVALMLKRLLRDGGMKAAATGTISAQDGVKWSLTQASGVGGANLRKPMGLDSCVGIHSMAEILIAYAAVKMTPEIGGSLDDAIATAYTPSGLSFQNPHNQQAITYKNLLQHTSTILDINFDTAINTGGSLAAFIDSYFVTSGGQLVSSVFATGKEPGTSSSHSFARVNIALMAYILERVISVKGMTQYTSLQHYIAVEILEKFGMGSTFFLNADGTAPGVMPSPAFSTTFDPAVSSAATAYTSYLQGCIIDQTTSSVQTHPAWPSALMAYSTVSDMLLLARGLFMDTTFRVTGLALRDAITVEPALRRSPSMTQSGLGLVAFDGSLVCAAGISTNVINDCPLNTQLVNTSGLYGYAVSAGTSMVGFVCGATADFGELCTVSAFVYNSAAARQISPVLATAAAAFQELTGNLTLTTPAPTASLRTEGEEQWFGVYVFIAVFGTLLIVVFGTSLLQYFFQPAALAMNANTAAATYALNGAGPGGASPKRRSPPRDALDD